MRSEMRSFLLLITISVFSIALYAEGQGPTPSSSPLPSKFMGKWKLDKDENFDEYLQAKGYGWFTRQLAKMASITKVFTDKGDGTYDCDIFTTQKDVKWNGWRPGVEFQGEYVDNTQHKTTIYYDAANDSLIERHVEVGSDKQPDIYEYRIDQNGYLVMHMTYNGVSTDRFYKQVN